LHVLFVACFTEVVSLVLQCETYEQLYVHSNITDYEEAITSLKDAVIETYIESLSFFASAIRHSKHGSPIHLVTAPFKLPNVEDHLANLSKCTTELSRLANIVEQIYVHCSFAGVEERLSQVAISLQELARDPDQVPQILAEMGQLEKMAQEQM
jgi:hypothetical protein